MLHNILTKSLPWELQLPPTGPGMSTVVQALVVPRESNPTSAPGKEFSSSGFTLHLKGCQEPKQSPEASLPLSLH